MKTTTQNPITDYKHISTLHWHITISRVRAVNSIISLGKQMPINWSNPHGTLLSCTLSSLTTTHCHGLKTVSILESKHTLKWPIKCTKKSVNNCMNTKQEILGIVLLFAVMISVSVLIAWHKGHINERIIDTINSVRSDSCVHGTRFIISCRSITLPEG